MIGTQRLRNQLYSYATGNSKSRRSTSCIWEIRRPLFSHCVRQLSFWGTPSPSFCTAILIDLQLLAQCDAVSSPACNRIQTRAECSRRCRLSQPVGGCSRQAVAGKRDEIRPAFRERTDGSRVEETEAHINRKYRNSLRPL